MQASDDFHKAGRRTASRRFAAATLALLPLACGPSDGDVAERAGRTSGGAADTVASAGPPAGYAWVIFGADTVLAEVAAVRFGSRRVATVVNST